MDTKKWCWKSQEVSLNKLPVSFSGLFGWSSEGVKDEEIPKKALVDKKNQEMEVSKNFLWPWIFRVNIPISHGCIASGYPGTPNWVYMSECGTPTSQTTDIFAKFPDQILWKKLRVSKISPLFVKNFAAMFWWMLTILTVALGLRPENVMEDEPLPCNERTQVVPAEMSKCLNTRSYGILFFWGGGDFWGDSFGWRLLLWLWGKQAKWTVLFFFNGAWAWSGWLLDHVGCLRWECSSVTSGLRLMCFVCQKMWFFGLRKRFKKQPGALRGDLSIHAFQPYVSNHQEVSLDANMRCGIFWM